MAPHVIFVIFGIISVVALVVAMKTDKPKPAEGFEILMIAETSPSGDIVRTATYTTSVWMDVEKILGTPITPGNHISVLPYRHSGIVLRD